MIVPEFWAEARIQKRFPERQVTVRRFGWSDVSQEAAQRHADERVQKAFDKVVAGEDLPRREPKVRYNGAEGLPIREEIVERYGDSIVTRNSYGARCLNTSNVFFADVDFPDSPIESLGVEFVISLIAVTIGTVSGYLQSNFVLGCALGMASFVVMYFFGASAYRLFVRLHGGLEQLTRKRILAFAATHPEWHLRRYRTPNGFRVMALHKTFDPRSAEVDEAFRALGVDRTYAIMCQKQNCFRARLSAKPWRIGIEQHLKPRPGVWPIAEERMPQRRKWLEEYDSSAANYAACRFEEAIGDVLSFSREAEAVCEFHDQACSAHRNFDLA